VALPSLTVATVNYTTTLKATYENISRWIESVAGVAFFADVSSFHERLIGGARVLISLYLACD
jgi:hypothetical protein